MYEPIVTPTEYYQTAVSFIQNRLSLFVLGDPGQGKTDITRQAAAEAGAAFLHIFLAVKDPVDIGGYPVTYEKDGEKRAMFVPFGDMYKLLTTDELLVCAADDMGIAPKIIQGAWMQVVCERTINGHDISDNVVFFSASNLKGGNTGVTTILDPLMNKHTSVIQLKNNYDCWCKWAVKAKKIAHEIVGFARFKPDVFEAYKPMPDLTQTPTARGLHHCSQILETGISGDLRGRIFAGSIGAEYASALDGYLQFYKDIPNPDSVIADPDTAPIPTGEPGKIYALCSALSTRAKPSSIDSIITYANRLADAPNAGREFTVSLVLDSVRKDPNCRQGQKFIDWNAANADLLV